MGFDVRSIIKVAVAQFNSMFVRLDEQNNYHVQSAVWATHVLPILSYGVCFFMTLRNSRVLRARERIALLVYPAVPLASFLIEIAFPGIWVSYLGAALALLLIYVNIQIELKSRLHEQELELANSRIAVVLSQIRPHFLYNSLTAINSLCEDNPRARQAVSTFAQYLRGNLDTLADNALVPIAKEMEHVRQYLWLEQLRFGEDLRVVYEEEADAFMLPALTVQPLVENAVNHGILQKQGGGTVRSIPLLRYRTVKRFGLRRTHLS